jgi:hypothetical protein
MKLRLAVHQLQAKLQCKWMQNATRDYFGGSVDVLEPRTNPHPAILVFGSKSSLT